MPLLQETVHESRVTLVKASIWLDWKRLPMLHRGRPGTKDFWQRDSRWEVCHRVAVRRALLGITETLVAGFPKSDEESRSNSPETTMHGSGGSVESRVHDRNQVVAYSVTTPNRVHVAAGQYLYWTSPSTSPSATKPIVRL